MARNLTPLERTQLELADVLKEMIELRNTMRLEIYGAPIHVHWIAENHVCKESCWCDPRVEHRSDGCDIVIHNRVQ